MSLTQPLGALVHPNTKAGVAEAYCPVLATLYTGFAKARDARELVPATNKAEAAARARLSTFVNHLERQQAIALQYAAHPESPEFTPGEVAQFEKHVRLVLLPLQAELETLEPAQKKARQATVVRSVSRGDLQVRLRLGRPLAAPALTPPSPRHPHSPPPSPASAALPPAFRPPSPPPRSARRAPTRTLCPRPAPRPRWRAWVCR